MTPAEQECRRLFEEWAATKGYYLEASGFENGTYAYAGTEMAWEGWQACWNRQPVPTQQPDQAPDAELLEEYEQAKENAVETCQGAHNSYGCGYDSGYREGIRFALYRGKADGK